MDIWEWFLDWNMWMEMAACLLALSGIFRSKDRKYVCIAATGILLLSSFVNSAAVNWISCMNLPRIWEYWSRALILTFFALGFSLIALKVNWKQPFFVTQFMVGHMMLIRTFIVIFMRQFLPLRKLAVFHLMILIGLTLIYRETRRATVNLSGFWWNGAVCIPALIIGMVGIWNIDYENYHSLFVGIILILLEWIIYSLFVSLSEEMERQIVLQLSNQNLSFQLDKMDYFRSAQEEIRKMHHEIKNYCFVLDFLLEQEKYEEAREYIHQTMNFSFDNREWISTGNQFLDMLLNQKMEEAQKNHIPFSVDALLPQDLILDERMMCSLLFNLLDNAIEASLKVSEPDIQFSMKEMKGYLTISVRNKIEESVLRKNPCLKTGKKDPHNHGIGTKVIRQIVKNEEGDMKVWEENGYFVTSVLLPVKTG